MPAPKPDGCSIPTIGDTPYSPWLHKGELLNAMASHDSSINRYSRFRVTTPTSLGLTVSGIGQAFRILQKTPFHTRLATCGSLHSIFITDVTAVLTQSGRDYVGCDLEDKALLWPYL
jgi:hypothetical protein